jgi:hypothetical protein
MELRKDPLALCFKGEDLQSGVEIRQNRPPIIDRMAPRLARNLDGSTMSRWINHFPLLDRLEEGISNQNVFPSPLLKFGPPFSSRNDPS